MKALVEGENTCPTPGELERELALAGALNISQVTQIEAMNTRHLYLLVAVLGLCSLSGLHEFRRRGGRVQSRGQLRCAGLGVFARRFFGRLCGAEFKQLAALVLQDFSRLGSA